MNKILYTYNGKELIGSNKIEYGIVVYDAYRVDSNGFLISEFSLVDAGTTSELAPLALSRGKVQSYTLCVPK
jgi:hypothetical protein